MEESDKFEYLRIVIVERGERCLKNSVEKLGQVEKLLECEMRYFEKHAHYILETAVGQHKLCKTDLSGGTCLWILDTKCI